MKVRQPEDGPLSLRMPRAIAPALLGMASLSLACSGLSRSPSPSGPAVVSAGDGCDPARDRQAILAMAGGYQVKFDFTETVPLASGYELKPPYRVGATELVVVAEDRPEQVVLQHILAMGDGEKRRALKHWRQDWTFQAQEVLEYRGGESWQKRRLGEGERRCTWAQQVYGIEDAPRYGSWGRWVHAGGASTWTSHETWRPLPRRELKRGDYDVIVGVNRHTITSAGWVHEQDNGKLVLRGRHQLLARERGVIPYTRAATEDFTAVARYWGDTQAFWREVRDGWREVIGQRDRLAFLPSARNPQSLGDDLDDLREQTLARPAAASERRRRVVETIQRHLAPARPLADNRSAP